MINNDWIFYFSNYTTATSDMSACCTAGPTVHWHDNELPIESNYNWIADLQYYDVQFLSTFAIKQVANSTVLVCSVVIGRYHNLLCTSSASAASVWSWTEPIHTVYQHYKSMTWRSTRLMGDTWSDLLYTNVSQYTDTNRHRNFTELRGVRTNSLTDWDPQQFQRR